MFRRMHEDRDRARVHALREVAGANALAVTLAVLHFVADDSDCEMNGFANGTLRGGDGVKAWLEFAKDFHKFLGSEAGGG